MVNLRAKLVNDTLDILSSEVTLESLKARYEKRLSESKLTDLDLSPILKKAENERSVEELRKIVFRKLADDDYKSKIQDYNSYKRLVEVEPEGASDTDSYEFYFTEDSDTITRHFRIKKNDSNKINEKIARLKRELSDSDWKVVRCYEASLINEEAPYDVKELTEKRAEIRKEINRLQELVK